MITGDVRRAVARAVAGLGLAAADPGLRPAGRPGRYASSVAFTLSDHPRDLASRLARTLATEPWIATAEVTGPGFLTVTVTPEALAAVAGRIIAAGPGCATSDALHGRTVAAAEDTDPLAAPTWEEARQALAAQLTARLAAAAGATVAVPPDTERVSLTPHHTHRPPPGRTAAAVTREATAGAGGPDTMAVFAIGPGVRGGGYGGSSPREATAGAGGPDTMAVFAIGPGVRGGGYGGSSPREATAFAGPDAVRFWLARAMPGKPVSTDPRIMARQVPENPAYAVRYAHARAASGVRWAATSRKAAAVPRCAPANPEELTLLDALSWLPERVVTAARRARPDEFARYLEELARATLAALTSASHPGTGRAPGTDKLTLSLAAQAGLAAGLALLGVSAPDRL